MIGINTRVCDLEKFEPAEFTKDKFAIFVLATHYEGDPCDNSKAFHKWMKLECKKAEIP